MNSFKRVSLLLPISLLVGASLVSGIASPANAAVPSSWHIAPNKIEKISTAHCTYEFTLGNYILTSYAKIRVTRTDPGYSCGVFVVKLRSLKGGKLVAVRGDGWTRTSKWHQLSTAYATAVSADYRVYEYHPATKRYTFFKSFKAAVS